MCRSRTAQAACCAPVDLFGANTVDPASYAYYLDDPVSNARIEQHVVSASLNGDFGQFFRLPGGPVQCALGGEYRRESSVFSPARSLLDNDYYQYDEYGIPSASRGSFDVKELFGELNAPLLKDAPFAYPLSIGAAGHLSDYSTVGATQAYTFNGIWAPVADISFRASYGQSVRAPNIAELFQPRTGASDFITDPCYIANRGSGTQYRDANCRTISRAAGNGYVVQSENVAAFHTAGLELNASYQVPTAKAGTFDLRLVGSYLHRIERIATPGADVEDQVDQTFRPEYSLTFSPTWTLNAVTLSYNLRWQDGVRRLSRFSTDGDPSFVDPRYFRFKPLWQHDVQVQFRTQDGFTFYTGVNNLGDRHPDIGFATNVPVSPPGRYFYAGAKVNLRGR